MEFLSYLKGFIESDETPVAICNLEHTVIYMNKAAAEKFSSFGGRELIGKSLATIQNEEWRSKIEMTIEWFKEDVNNNKVFSYHDKKENQDMYICAIRSEDGQLIGYCNRRIPRTPETKEAYMLD